MLKLRCMAPAWIGVFFALPLQGGSFADSVAQYTEGAGFTPGFTNASAALGEPSRVTPGMVGGPVDPFSPPYLPEQLVSLGAGGSLTVQFSSPVLNAADNPFGLDFIIFKNNGFSITNGDFSGGGITDGTLFTFDSPGASRVSVSVDNANYYALVPPTSLTPVVDGLYPTDGMGNFLLPVNPAFSSGDFAGRNLEGIRELYAGSGGGTGFDIGWAQTADGQGVMLDEIRFVRIDLLSGKVEIDGVAAVPEPAVWTSLGLGLAGVWISSCRRGRKIVETARPREGSWTA